MMRSMYASVSGLSSHQDMFDVIGNNISNVNTVGYKGSRTTFKEMLNQTIRGATAPQAGRGGTDPVQMGLGVETGSIDSNMSAGSLQSTGNKSDAAIQGEGFFIVNDGNQNVYTRAGNMTFDRDGYLTNSSNGYRVQGWIAEEDGTLDNLSPDQINDIRLDQSMEPESTENIDYTGNLNKSMFELSAGKSSLTVDDGSGNTGTLLTSISETEHDNIWQYRLDAQNCEIDNEDYETGYIVMDEADPSEVSNVYLNLEDAVAETNEITGGDFDFDVTINGGTETVSLIQNGQNIADNTLLTATNSEDEIFGSYADKTITTDVYDTQGGKHTVKLKIERTGFNQWIIRDEEISVGGTNTEEDWFGSDYHEINFDKDGIIDGESNTLSLTFDVEGDLGEQTVELDFSDLTQFGGNMTADFDTVDGYPSGEFTTFSVGSDGIITGSFDNGQNKPLAKISLANFSNPAGLLREEGVFMESNNSGEAKIGEAGIGGRGELAPASLEMSNVDMAEQFTSMISAQRGYQANSKIITTSDEMMQQVVNMKR